MTYAALAAVFLAGAALTAVAAARLARPPRGFWLAMLSAAVVLLVLTVVFDTLMVAADLFRYDTDALLGWRVLLVPVEDLAWPLAASLALPALWELLGAREEPSHER